MPQVGKNGDRSVKRKVSTVPVPKVVPGPGHPTVPDGTVVRSVKRPVVERGVPPVPKLTNRGPAGLNTKIEREGPFAPPKTELVEVAEGKKNRVAKSLQHLIVDITTLLPDPDNARLHPERNLNAIMDSLRQYGQMKPLVVRKQTRVVVAGNGTLEAAKALGWTKIAAAFEAMDDATAAGYGIADNRTAELAKWDLEVVARLDQLLMDNDHPTIGWSRDELEVLRAADWIPPPVDPDFGRDKGNQPLIVSFTPDEYEAIESVVDALCFGDESRQDWTVAQCLSYVCKKWLEQDGGE